MGSMSAERLTTQPRVDAMTTRHYDIVVLGAGSGRMVLDEQFQGLRTAIIDHGPYGGTCLNRGCIPSKMFLHVAESAASVPELARLGVDARVDRVRWDDIRDRIFSRIDAHAESGPPAARKDGIDAYEGSARFVGPRQLIVESADGKTELTADRIVLATGAHPIVPEVFSSSGVDFVTSDTVMRLPELPRRMLGVGGGPVGLEMAQMFTGLGVEVTLVAQDATLAGPAGEDIGRRYTEVLRERLTMHLDTEVTGLRQQDDGIHAQLKDGTTLVTDLLLLAAGRAATTEGLGLAEAGVELDERGRVVIDEFGRTSAEGVWALGDVVNTLQLKHLANDQAHVITHNLLHPDDLKPLCSKAIPAAIFTDPQLAWIGSTLEQAREAGRDAVAFTQRLADTAYGWALEDTTSVCTVVVERGSGAVLGAQIMAPNAATLIQPLVDAAAREESAREVATRQLWIHPAPTELVENALLGAADAAS